MRHTSPTHAPPPAPPAPQQHALHHAKCLTALVTASTPMPTRHTGALSRQRADSAPATTVGVLEPDTCSSTSISISIGGQDHGIGGQASHAEASAHTTQCTGVAVASAPTVTCKGCTAAYATAHMHAVCILRTCIRKIILATGSCLFCTQACSIWQLFTSHPLD
jgi:phage-related tail fiber protein